MIHNIRQAEATTENEVLRNEINSIIIDSMHVSRLKAEEVTDEVFQAVERYICHLGNGLIKQLPLARMGDLD